MYSLPIGTQIPLWQNLPSQATRRLQHDATYSTTYCYYGSVRTQFSIHQVGFQRGRCFGPFLNFSPSFSPAGSRSRSIPSPVAGQARTGCFTAGPARRRDEALITSSHIIIPCYYSTLVTFTHTVSAAPGLSNVSDGVCLSAPIPRPPHP